MKKMVFNGTHSGKFTRWGVNNLIKLQDMDYKPVSLRLSWLENNLAQVCEQGSSKGLCKGDCTHCPIQGAYESTKRILEVKATTAPASTNITFVFNNCTFTDCAVKDLCGKERTGLTFEEMRKRVEEG